MKFFTISCFRDGPDLLDRCLESIAAQQDVDVSAVVCDDRSRDHAVTDVLHKWRDHLPEGSVIRRNPKHYGPLRSQVESIRSVEMAPDDVLVWVDGDDRLNGPDALAKLARVYRNPLVDVTYGSYEPDPPSKTCPPVRPIPRDVCAGGGYRAWHARRGCWYNHLRTMRRRVFDAIPDSHFVRDGRWLMSCADHALFVPALELAGGRHVMLEDKLLLYTSDRDTAEWRTRAQEVRRNSQWILSLPPLAPLPPVQPIEDAGSGGVW